MNNKQWLEKSIQILQKSEIPTAQLDAEVILADFLNRDRSWLHANPEKPLSDEDVEYLDSLIVKRTNHTPIAYIVGKQEFYKRVFKVSPDTLTPRPETETLVELALDIIKNNHISSIADIGSGSGCIIITLELEARTNADFMGYEISKPALKISEENARILKSSATFKECDINKDIIGWQDAELVVANLPYVPTDFKINLAASHEPEFAIYGGKDGLDYYRTMFDKLTNKNNFVICECLPPQQPGLTEIAEKSGYKLLKTEDLITVFARA